MPGPYHAVRVDMENNAESFWDTLREKMPSLAKALERYGCAVVSNGAYEQITSLGAFNGEPSPLIDCGDSESGGDMWGNVVSGPHAVVVE